MEDFRCLQGLFLIRHTIVDSTSKPTSEGKLLLENVARSIHRITNRDDSIPIVSSCERKAVESALYLADFMNTLPHPKNISCHGIRLMTFDGLSDSHKDNYEKFVEFMKTGINRHFLIAVGHEEFVSGFPNYLSKKLHGKEILNHFGKQMAKGVYLDLKAPNYQVLP